MACGIGLQNVCMHNKGAVNSFVWYIKTGAAPQMSGFNGEGEEGV